MDVLVTGADQHQSLAIIRSLGKKGLKVLACGPDKNSLGFFSRYAAARHVYTSPLVDSASFIDDIINILKIYKVKLIIPSIESTLAVLDEHRIDIEKLSPIASPSSEIINRALDKKKTYEIAQSAGVPIPKTAYVSSIAEGLEVCDRFGYPVALKPRGLKVYKKIPGELDFKVAYASSRKELLEILEKCSETGVYPIIQQFCEGIGICVSTLVSDGAIQAMFQYRRLRETPITGGVSVVRESMQLDPRLKGYVTDLLKAMDWYGIAMVEFKYNEKQDKYTLMEVNGRFQASTALALHAGVDLPYMVYELFANKNKIFSDGYRTGVKCRWLRGDLKGLEKYLTGDTQNEFVTSGRKNLPSKKKVLIDFLKDFNPAIYGDIFSVVDPMPGIHEGWRLFQEYIIKVIKRLFK